MPRRQLDKLDEGAAMTRSDPIPSTGKRHPIFARVFARAGPAMDAQGALDHRRALLAGLAGRVLEVGAGSGLNFAHYPPAVTELLAVEPEPYLRALAETAAQQAAIPIRVVDGTADTLPSPDAGMDAAVASLVLCSVPDQARALAELRRVLRPGGELRFFEHIQADTSGLARAQRLADVIWPTLVGGCHTSRDTLTAITTAGFHLISIRRFRFPDSRLPSPAAPHVLGIARRPPESRPEGRHRID
jgi:ubiquinone/menaquinone biosynthesis C-methylase UbiE